MRRTNDSSFKIQEDRFVDEVNFPIYLEKDESPIQPKVETEHTIFGGKLYKNFNDAMTSNSRNKVKKLFRLIDKDGNNYLDRVEFRTAIAVKYGKKDSQWKNIPDVREKIDLSDKVFNTIFSEINLRKDGEVDFKELWLFLKPKKAESQAEKDDGSHGNLYHLMKYNFLKAISTPLQGSYNNNDDPFIRHHLVAHRFKLYLKVVVPYRELRDFENKLIGGMDGSGLYAGQKMPVSTKMIPSGSLLVYVREREVDLLMSVDIRNLISFVGEGESLECTFLNQAALTVFQRNNMPDEVYMVLSKEDRENLIMEQEERNDRDDLPLYREGGLYPPGHNKHTPEKWKRPMAYRLHRTMEDETYSTLSYTITILVMTMIVVSTVAYILESIPLLEKYKIVWKMLEAIISIVFTVEYALRIMSCKNKCVYFTDCMNLVDFLAFMPYWIEMLWRDGGSSQLRIIRVIRLARIIRLLRSRNFITYLIIFQNTFYMSVKGCGLLLTIFFLEIIVCASLVYVAERGNLVDVGVCDDWMTNSTRLSCSGEPLFDFGIVYSNEECLLNCMNTATAGCCHYDQSYFACNLLNTSKKQIKSVNTTTDVLNIITPTNYFSKCHTKSVMKRSDDKASPFFSIPNGMWWCVVTMTTVGYGEMYPTTTYGQCIAVLTMFSGLLVIALPVIIVGTDFHTANLSKRRKDNRSNSYHQALSRMKNDRSGTIEEFFREVNEFFKNRYNTEVEEDDSTYEYQPVLFDDHVQSSFYEAGYSNRYQIEAVLKRKRGYIYFPNYLHIPAYQNRYRPIPKYISFSLWHTYGQWLRKDKIRKLRSGNKVTPSV